MRFYLRRFFRSATYLSQYKRMSRHDFQIPVHFKHRIVFTRNAFAPANPCLGEILAEGNGRRALVCIEKNVAEAWPALAAEAEDYLARRGLEIPVTLILAGGESVKNDDSVVQRVWREIDCAKLDRHSYLLCIGGGAFLDAVGFAAATAHRGVRLIRFPTTTLSQDDSGVGVKCAINQFGKKNWVGAFAVPFAVINDFRFLHTQPVESRRAGLIEAVKVSLVKDEKFFDWIERHTEALHALDPATVEECVERSAVAHASHIATGGDPFENGSSRPLDFGHWAAHKLEALTSMRLSHAEAVAIGMAIDCVYAEAAGHLDAKTCRRIINVIRGLDLPLHHPALEKRDACGRRVIFSGLDEFREHLGGELTILLPVAPGKMIEVGHIATELLDACIDRLRELNVHATFAAV
ncbi:MAG: 3-dehydroquinate synthase [Luteolibacter sp.]